MTQQAPDLSVVLNTFNRADRVQAAIASVLDQTDVEVELVIVDDGSTDATASVLASIEDPRVRIVRHGNRGLSASRNTGAEAASSTRLLFLDDDDILLPGALHDLLIASEDERLVALGGVRYVDPEGRVLRERPALSLADAQAGSFVVDRALFQRVGGYLVGLPCSHQTELFVRLASALDQVDGGAAYIDRTVVKVEKRPTPGRPEQSPSHSYFGGRWLAVRHPTEYADRKERAKVETIIGVNAMRIGREREARRRLARALCLDPASPGRYARLAGAAVSPVGRRFWLRQWHERPEPQRLLERVQRRPATPAVSDELALERDPDPGPDSLFLPWNYVENPVRSSDEAGTPFWSEGIAGNDVRFQEPVYRLAAKLVRNGGLVPVVDIGCGSGHKLVRRIGEVTSEFIGVDQPSGIAIAKATFPDRDWLEGDLSDEEIWHEVIALKPRLVICSDVIEHVPDPRRLLSAIRVTIGARGLALISTPDRARLSKHTRQGPPGNARHVREWTAEEFALLLESCGFDIVRVEHRLPRAYSPTVLELKRVVWRAFHRQAIPDRRSSMSFLVRRATASPASVGGV